MPKLYYPTPDELQGAPPLNELIWFEQYQSQLVVLANTNEGRDLLCIDSWRQRPYPVVAIEKNVVKFYLGRWSGQDHWLSDFRVGAKWGNVIRYRWQQIRMALSRIELQEMMAWQSLGGRQRVMARFATSTFYPDPHPEDTTVDGAASQSLSDTDWDTIHDSAGGAFSDTGTVFQFGRIKGTADAWVRFDRGIILFLTSDLGSDIIDSATFEAAADEAGNAHTDSVSLVLSAPASNDVLVAGDYDSLGATKQAADVAIAGITADSATYNVWTLNATGLSNIATGGVTKLGGRCTSDADDSEAGGDGEGNIRILGADQSGLSKDPKLVVIHSSPFTPKAIMF